MSAASMATTDINFGVINFDVGVSSRQKAELRHGTLETTNRYKANIFHINADQMLRVYTTLGEDFLLIVSIFPIHFGNLHYFQRNGRLFKNDG